MQNEQLVRDQLYLLVLALYLLTAACPNPICPVQVHSEMAALQAAGVEYEVCPGVSSALAAPLAAGFPLTHPQLSRAFAVTSAHDPASLDWQALAVRQLCLVLAAPCLASCCRWQRGILLWAGQVACVVLGSAGAQLSLAVAAPCLELSPLLLRCRRRRRR